ncbi:TetR/AcrR family transcriptional regulator [Gordonia terrae]
MSRGVDEPASSAAGGKGAAYERRRTATRCALMTAIRRCVSADGYANTSVERIVSEAGVGRATFYLHFTGKAALANAVIDDVREQSRAVLPSSGGAPLSAAELSDAVSTWVSMYRTESDAFVLWHEAAANEPGIERPIDVHSSSIVRSVVGPGMEHLTDDDLERAEVIARMMFLGLERVCFAWYVSGWKTDEALLVDEVVSAWVGYFVPRLQALSSDVDHRSRSSSTAHPSAECSALPRR